MMTIETIFFRLEVPHELNPEHGGANHVSLYCGLRTAESVHRLDCLTEETLCFLKKVPTLLSKVRRIFSLVCCAWNGT
jgi:hypothetical protein